MGNKVGNKVSTKQETGGRQLGEKWETMEKQQGVNREPCVPMGKEG